MIVDKKVYFELKSSGLKRREIAESLGISESSLKKHISKNGWAQARAQVRNENFFSEFTEEACYWAGFIAADGCIKDSGTLSICLNYDDTNHIEKFKQAVGSSHKISSNTEKYYRSEINFRNQQITRDLKENFNIVPRKTHIYTPPSCIPDDKVKHFMRGYFDGDGCICESFSNKNSKTATLYTTIVGTKETLEFFENTLALGGGGSWQAKRKNIFALKYNTKHSLSLLDYMYAGSTVFLDRKYNLYYKILVENTRKSR